LIENFIFSNYETEIFILYKLYLFTSILKRGRLAAAVNVWGNCLATASVSHLSRYEIEESKV